MALMLKLILMRSQLIEWCSDHLARYKCPRSVDFDQQLPRLESGKLLKRLLRDRYREAPATAGQPAT